MNDLIVFDCEQNSDAWMAARLGVPSASGFADILAKGEGKTRRKYLLKLAGEILTGEQAESYTNGHMERGHAMEAEARNKYQFQTDADLSPVGFMKRGRAGCSPDRLIDTRGVLEIKTKLPHLQLEVLEAGKLPPEHKAQVQGQLWVSGRNFCDFVSYWPRLPLFCIRVERDETYIRALEQAVAEFVGELDTLVTKYRSAA